MDTNSNNLSDKSNKKIFLSTPLLILLLALFSLLSVSVYKLIINQPRTSQKMVNTYLESVDFSYQLVDLTHYLKHNELQEDNSYPRNYSNMSNLKYYMVSTDSNKSVSNIKNISDELLRESINSSQFYLHVLFDKNGNMTIQELTSSKNFSTGSLVHAFDNYRVLHNDLHFNLEVTYIVPATLIDANDFINRGVENHTLTYALILIFIIGIISIFLLTLLALCIPYTHQERLSLVAFFNKLFLEFKLLTWLGFLATCLVLTESITSHYNTNQLITIITTASPLFYLLGIPITFILYLLIYLAIVYTRSIYHNGLRQGFIKNILVARVLYAMIKSIKKLFIMLISIDLTKAYSQKLISVLLVNLFALILIGASWPFGFILAIAYSIALFYYLVKIADKVKMLIDSSNQLASGTFNFVLDENIGVLKPIAQNLNNIKSGFKVAVEKEVQSQNMKTELISSVSHDLRTPLTSIITYVDLLKDKGLSADTQQDYIHVLDKKSRRLQMLIEDLFEASRATSGTIELHLEPLDLTALLKQTLGELEEKIQASHLQIKTKFPDYKILCSLDGQRTYRIFENLIGNILKYSLPQSRVYIHVVDNVDDICIVFKNISAYEMDFDISEITERFTRGDKARHTEGSGLGLAIAKSLTTLQNGLLDIYVDGDLFKVTVSFPKLPMT